MAKTISCSGLVATCSNWSDETEMSTKANPSHFCSWREHNSREDTRKHDSYESCGYMIQRHTQVLSYCQCVIYSDVCVCVCACAIEDLISRAVLEKTSEMSM